MEQAQQRSNNIASARNSSGGLVHNIFGDETRI
jgi:hypothetical protein